MKNPTETEIQQARIDYCRARSECDYYWRVGQGSGYAYQENGMGGTQMLDRARERMHRAMGQLKQMGIEWQNDKGEHLPWVREILQHCSAGNYLPPTKTQ